MNKFPLYLDYQATTPVDPRVVEAMMPYLMEKFGNPHSAGHPYGWEAEAAVNKAREQLANLIGASTDEVIFTSGATEANNLIIKGVMECLQTSKPDMITVCTEHKSVLEPAQEAVKRSGGTLHLLSVDSGGVINLDELKSTLTEKTALVSVMTLNNEIGTIQPLKEIAAITHAGGALFHSDAAQAFGKIPLDVRDVGIDFMSFTGHKIYAPKGIGGAYIKKNKQRVVTRQISGGLQEQGLRAGTLAPAQCAAFGAATVIAGNEMIADTNRIGAMMNTLVEKLMADIKGLKINGSMENRWCGNINICLPGLSIDLLMSNLRNLALSSSSACSSGLKKPSHVLSAIGLNDDDAMSSLRIGIGRYSTMEEIDYAANELISVVEKLGGVKA